MTKRVLKIAKGVNGFVPTSMNFSDLQKNVKDDDIDFEVDDGGLEERRIQDSLEYEEMIVQILSNLEMREKLIFSFELMRDSGIQVDHTSFAKTIGITRSQYMKVLSQVRCKAALFVIGYNNLKRDTNRAKNL